MFILLKYLAWCDERGRKTPRHSNEHRSRRGSFMWLHTYFGILVRSKREGGGWDRNPSLTVYNNPSRTRISVITGGFFDNGRKFERYCNRYRKQINRWFKISKCYRALTANFERMLLWCRKMHMYNIFNYFIITSYIYEFSLHKHVCNYIFLK